MQERQTEGVCTQQMWRRRREDASDAKSTASVSSPSAPDRPQGLLSGMSVQQCGGRSVGTAKTEGALQMKPLTPSDLANSPVWLAQSRGRSRCVRRGLPRKARAEGDHQRDQERDKGFFAGKTSTARTQVC